MKALLLSLCLLPMPLLAQQGETPTIEPFSSSYLIKLTGGLLVVVMLIFLLAWLMKKMNLSAHHQHGLIKIISSLNFGRNERILLIEVGNEQILVGLCPGRIEKLHTLATKLEINTATDSSDAAQSQFMQMMSGIRNMNGSNK